MTRRPAEGVVQPVQPQSTDAVVPAGGSAATLLGTWSAPAGTVTRGDAVGKFRATDRAAAEELFNACYPRLAGWVRRLVDDDDTAHEIAAEALTRQLARW